MLLLENCLLYTMKEDAEPLPGGEVLIRDGKIAAVGRDLEVPEGCPRLDAGGKMVTPGLVESHCHLGGSDLAGSNINERTNPVLPGLRGLDGIDLTSPTFYRALRTGVTTLITGPGSANIMGGTFTAVKTAADSPEKRVFVEEVSLKMALGENPKMVYGKKNKAPLTRMACAALMREALYKAKNYREKWLKYQQEGGSFSYDHQLHSLMRAFDGMIVKIHAHTADDIRTAIRVGKEFGLKVTLDHCTEGHLMIDEIKESGFSPIIGPLAGGKSKVELQNKTMELPGIMEKAGVPFSLTTDSGVIPMEGLLMQAALVIKHGASRGAILTALTRQAAVNGGVIDRVGTLEEGKDADLVIWNTHPFDTYGAPETVIVDGVVRYERKEA